MEGVGQAVLGHFIALSQRGLLDIFRIILQQAVVSVDQDVGVHSLGGGENIPGVGVAGIDLRQGVLQGVAVVGQPLLALGLPGAGAGQLGPHGLQGLAVSSRNGLRDHDGTVQTGGVGTPHRIGDRIGRHAADGVAAAVGGGGQEEAGLQQLGLGSGHLHQTEIHILFFSHGLFVGGVEVAQRQVVELIGQGLIVVARQQVGVGIDQPFGFGVRRAGISRCIRAGIRTGSLVAGAGNQRQGQSQNQQQCE